MFVILMIIILLFYVYQTMPGALGGSKGKFETYLQTNSNRFINTGQEGFAVSDITGNIVKLVDRYEFSYAKFSPEIKKGWTK